MIKLDQSSLTLNSKLGKRWAWKSWQGMKIKVVIFFFYVGDSKGTGHLEKNFRRGGTGSDLYLRKFTGGWLGWNGKNGGCKTSSEVTAVITLVSFKIWKLWNIESLVARGLSAFRNAGSPRLPHSTGRHSLLCFSLKITLHTSNWLYLREENLVPLSSQLKLG